MVGVGVRVGVTENTVTMLVEVKVWKEVVVLSFVVGSGRMGPGAVGISAVGWVVLVFGDFGVPVPAKNVRVERIVVVGSPGVGIKMTLLVVIETIVGVDDPSNGRITLLEEVIEAIVAVDEPGKELMSAIETFGFGNVDGLMCVGWNTLVRAGTAVGAGFVAAAPKAGLTTTEVDRMLEVAGAAGTVNDEAKLPTNVGRTAAYGATVLATNSSVFKVCFEQSLRWDGGGHTW